jgi:hypothetical protein
MKTRGASPATGRRRSATHSAARVLPLVGAAGILVPITLDVDPIHDIDLFEPVLAAIRPDSWNAALFLHVLGGWCSGAKAPGRPRRRARHRRVCGETPDPSRRARRQDLHDHRAGQHLDGHCRLDADRRARNICCRSDDPSRSRDRGNDPSGALRVAGRSRGPRVRRGLRRRLGRLHNPRLRGRRRPATPARSPTSPTTTRPTSPAPGPQSDTSASGDADGRPDWPPTLSSCLCGSGPREPDPHAHSVTRHLILSPGFASMFAGMSAYPPSPPLPYV